MYHHIDHLVALGMAEERERDLRRRLRQDQAEAARGTTPRRPVPHGLLAHLRDVLVHAHLLHAPTQ